MEKIKVWDRFIRFYHWTQVIILFGLWYSAKEDSMDWHFTLAYLLLCLLVTRIIWGVLGGETAKFSHFIHHPFIVFKNKYKQKMSNHINYIGHTPIGGYMVISLFTTIGVQISTGLFISDNMFYDGPLAFFITDYWSGILTYIHKLNFNVILGLITLHIGAIVLYFINNHNLISPMLWGKKLLPKGTTCKLKSSWPAFIILFIVIVIVFGILYISDNLPLYI